MTRRVIAWGAVWGALTAIIAFCAYLPPAPAFAAGWSLIQWDTLSDNVGTNTTEKIGFVTQATTTGNLLTLFGGEGNGTDSITACNDKGTGAMTVSNVGQKSAEGSVGFCYVVATGQANDTITETIVTGSNGTRAWIAEWHGNAASSVFDLGAMQHLTNTTSASSGAFTTNFANELVVGFVENMNDGSAHTITAGSGYSQVVAWCGGNVYCAMGEWQNQAAAGSITATGTLSGNDDPNTVGGGFKASAGGGGGPAGSENRTLTGVGP